MAMLVGHGYEEARVLDLTLPQFNELAQTVLRVHRRNLAEWSRATMLAAQGSPKDLERWLKDLLPERDKKPAGGVEEFKRAMRCRT